MKKLIITLFAICLVTLAYGQDPIELSEVTVVARNYKYLNKTDSKVATIPVKLLQRKAATYNIKEADFYDDEFDYYTVSFFIPDGKIVAVYDADGKIVRTIEKYKNIALPNEVTSAVLKRFPKWKISKDAYLIKYHQKKGAKKTYKLTLENGDERLKVKMDDIGNFL
ncbi:MAG: nicotinate-nucleotide adenylyltransferase [Flavobacteriaceae bacterium]|nr:nicotinate-nucleotide adenylyltransferase [Flavobacteriaceae bacterium]